FLLGAAMTPRSRHAVPIPPACHSRVGPGFALASSCAGKRRTPDAQRPISNSEAPLFGSEKHFCARGILLLPEDIRGADRSPGGSPVVSFSTVSAVARWRR